MADLEPRVPTRAEAIVYHTKVQILRAQRGLKNATSPVTRLPRGASTSAAAISSSVTPLYTETNAAEQRLQLGKIQNLRIACRAIDGIAIAPGETFSFWRHLGKPTRSRGYVEGRQIQEGCVIPAVAGGICQLSNALYSCALDARCEIVERHPHTRSLSRVSPFKGRDATVAWNHIDLRFRSQNEITIRVRLTRDSLVVEFLGGCNSQVSRAVRTPRILQDANSCETCGQEDCFRFGLVDRSTVSQRTAYVLNQTWQEFADYINRARHEDDSVFAPLRAERGRPQFQWKIEGLSDAPFLYLRRALVCRKLKAGALRRAVLDFDAKFAEAFGRRLPIEATHVVISLSMLPHLWRAGWLGGRTFDVLADRLPMSVTRSLLDEAYAKHPARGLLADFRADDALVKAETDALAEANSVITPSAYVASLFPDRSVRIPWSHSEPVSFTQGAAILFPGPTAARKGAYEVREVARRLGLTVVLTGGQLEGPDFWDGVDTIRRSAGENAFNGCFAVVQPSIVEEQPRAQLAALASGLKVITTDVCGLDPHPNLTTVPTGDDSALEAAVKALMV